MELELLPRAEQDIRAIWSYIAQDSPRAADRVAASLFDSLEMLLQQPRMGAARPELAEGLRALTSGSYVVFYRPLDTRVQVVRILHGRRDTHADLF
jgi:toxin ParE1/3/4